MFDVFRWTLSRRYPQHSQCCTERAAFSLEIDITIFPLILTCQNIRHTININTRSGSTLMRKRIPSCAYLLPRRSDIARRGTRTCVSEIRRRQRHRVIETRKVRLYAYTEAFKYAGLISDTEAKTQHRRPYRASDAIAGVSLLAWDGEERLLSENTI